MNMTYLILDIGTGNSRAALVDSTGRIIGISTFENVYYRDFRYQDAQYFLPSEWAGKILSNIKQLLERFPDVQIQAVTSTSARESIVLIDREGNAFYGLPNIDNRGSGWMESIPDTRDIYYSTGRWVSPVFSALKLVGLREAREDIYKNIAAVTSLSEWLGYLFTGRIVIEESQACETQLYDIHRHEWSETLCEKFHIEGSILPEVVYSGNVIGNIRDDLRKELGLSQGIVFMAGGADTQTAVEGIQGDDGGICIVSGTTSPIVKIVDEAFYDKAQRCWVDCYLEKGRYQIETNAGVSGLNYQRLKKLFFSDVCYEEMDRRMEAKERIQCVASFGTLIFSENRSLKNGGFYLPAPLDENCDRYDFAYACIADIVCSIYAEYRNLCDLAGEETEAIRGCGGGFQSKLMCQMLADLTGKKIVLPRGYRQASLLGCMELCNDRMGISAGVHEPEQIYLPKKDSMIQEYYKKWKDIRKLIN